MKSFGFTDFIVCAGYCQKKIVDFLGSGKKFGIRVGYSVEVDVIGTAGALKCAVSTIGENNFIVINGDILTNLNIRKIPTSKHTVAVVPFRSPFGIVETDDNTQSFVNGFLEKPVIQDVWINAGVYNFGR